MKSIKIKHCKAYGKLFENITDGSIHKIIPPPKGFKRDLKNTKGVWVMGVGGPVKILYNEFTRIG